MDHVAATYFRQARSFLRAGDSHRAVELLERARVLAGNDRELLRGVLQELSAAYGQIGNADKAARCREQLAIFGPVSTASITTDAAQAREQSISPPILTPARRRAPIKLPGGGLAVPAGILLVAVVILGIMYWRLTRGKVVYPPITPLAASSPSIQMPASSPSSRVAISSASNAPASLVLRREADGVTEQLLKDNVGLVVALVHYEGDAAGQRIVVENPIGIGTAFAVDGGGLMLTNRHVANMGQDAQIEPTLESLGLPTVTRRRTDLLVCFGSDAVDHYKAQVVLSSNRFDMALLKVERKFSKPLVLATASPHQGEDVFVCGYPGAVVKLLNEAAQSPAQRDRFLRQARTTGRFDFFLESFSVDSFNSTLTKGIVSAAERNIQGAAYLQTDAAVNPGNSGGPVLNQRHEVIGIATLKVKGEGIFEQYNFALLLDQLKDELEPYLKVNE